MARPRSSAHEALARRSSATRDLAHAQSTAELCVSAVLLRTTVVSQGKPRAAGGYPTARQTKEDQSEEPLITASRGAAVVHVSNATRSARGDLAGHLGYHIARRGRNDARRLGDVLRGEHPSAATRHSLGRTVSVTASELQRFVDQQATSMRPTCGGPHADHANAAGLSRTSGTKWVVLRRRFGIAAETMAQNVGLTAARSLFVSALPGGRDAMSELNLAPEPKTSYLLLVQPCDAKAGPTAYR